MSHRPDGHGPLRWMGNFKAVQIDYEYYLTLSDEPMAVCLTERQMYVLSVQNTYTYWGTRWYNTDDVSEAQLKLIAAEIEDLLMCGCGVPEPSIVDRFTANTYMTTTNTFYEETYNTWNDAGQTVISIAPNLDFGTGDPVDIDKVNCLSINILLHTIIDAAIAYKRQTTQEKKDITKNLASVMAALAAAGGAAIASGGILAAGMAFLGGPLTVFGLAMAAVGLYIANLVETTDLSVFQDPEAIEQIRCTLVQNMLGEQLTRPRFQGGLTPNAFTPGSNAEKLAAVIQPYLDDLNVYLQFLVTGNGLYDAVDIGVLPECEVCGPRYPLYGPNPYFAAQVLEFLGYDGDYDVWQVMTCDCPTTIVMDNGQTYTHGYNVALVGTPAASFDDNIAGGNSLWGLWVDAVGTLLNARHFPNTSGTGQVVVQGHTASNILCKFRVKPR